MLEALSNLPFDETPYTQKELTEAVLARAEENIGLGVRVVVSDPAPERQVTKNLSHKISRQRTSR